MRIQFWMSDMASGNPNWISGDVTKDTQGLDQKQRIFSAKNTIFSLFSNQKHHFFARLRRAFDLRADESDFDVSAGA